MTNAGRPFWVPAIAILAAAIASACGPGANATVVPGGSPSTDPTSIPTSTPAIGAIQHPTGAHDVVLRVEESGGFVPIEFMATSAPSFTLYGDGTVVFRDPTASPPTSNDNISRAVPFETIHLGEDAIQSLLTAAIGPGGLGIATGPYLGLGADIPSTTFTIAADGRTKTVSVTGLSPVMHPQDVGIVTALTHLGELLNGFGSAVGGEEPYVPAAFRGVLTPIDQAIGPVKAWPWTTIFPTDFANGANGALETHTLSAADVAALGIDGAAGGLQGLTLQAGTKLYSFALRPLLPDETE